MAFNKQIQTVLKGILMGAADVVPGVSGGTIAFITGIYEELITTIDQLDFKIITHFKNKGFKETVAAYNLVFLISLLSGIAISIVSLSKLIIYLLENYTIMVWSFFFGLVAASVWYIGSQIEKWQASTLLVILVGTALSYYITIAQPLGSPDSWWYIIFSGFIGIIAMILPGVSGAFLLLLLGSYEKIIGSISAFIEAIVQGDWTTALANFKTLTLFAIGCILGLKLFSKFLKWLFTNHKDATLALLTGFMLGSLNKLWPWKEVLEYRVNSHGEQVPFLDKSILPSSHANPQITIAIVLMLTGFMVILILEKWASKKQH